MQWRGGGRGRKACGESHEGRAHSVKSVKDDVVTCYCRFHLMREKVGFIERETLVCMAREFYSMRHKRG